MITTIEVGGGHDEIMAEVKRRLVERHPGLANFGFVYNPKDRVMMFSGERDGVLVVTRAFTDREMKTVVMGVGVEQARRMVEELVEGLSRWWTTGHEKPMARCLDDVGCDDLEEGALYQIVHVDDKYLTIVLDGEERRMYVSRFEIEGGG